MEHYVCIGCGYIYKPEIGDPTQNIKPDTAFSELPETWQCPICYVGKEEFDPL
jgi:rubredoxin